MRNQHAPLSERHTHLIATFAVQTNLWTQALSRLAHDCFLVCLASNWFLVGVSCFVTEGWVPSNCCLCRPCQWVRVACDVIFIRKHLISMMFTKSPSFDWGYSHFALGLHVIIPLLLHCQLSVLLSGKGFWRCFADQRWWSFPSTFAVGRAQSDLARYRFSACNLLSPDCCSPICAENSPWLMGFYTLRELRSRLFRSFVHMLLFF